MNKRFDGDFCNFFRNLERDPRAIQPTMTIGEMLKARQHVQQCEECYDIVERVAAMIPPDDQITMSNMN